MVIRITQRANNLTTVQKHLTNTYTLMKEKENKFDVRMKQLEERGFTHNRVGLRNDELISSLLYHQIEIPTDDEWADFMEELDKKLK